MFTAPYTFLTTKPQHRRLCTLFPELLHVLPITGGVYDLEARIYYTDGTNAAYEIEGSLLLAAGEVRYWDVSQYSQDYAAVNPSKTISKIKIWLGTEDANEQLHYYPYTPTTDELRAIYYNNTAGGIDTVICMGDEQRSQGNFAIDTVSPMVMEMEIQSLRQYGLSGQRARTGHTLHTAHRYSTSDEMLALRDFDLLRTGWLFEVVNNLPKMLNIILTGSIPYAAARSTLVAVPITFQFAFEEKAFDRVGL